MNKEKAITSAASPLRIDAVACRNGLVGLTLCPGKKQQGAISGVWERDLDVDIAAIKSWGAGIVITLIEDQEFVKLGVERLPRAVAEAGMAWLHLPIRDMYAPDRRFMEAWPGVSATVHDLLEAGGRVLVHCMGGLGRAGTVATQILIESGVAPGAAIYMVRAARPGAVQTDEQEDYVLGMIASPGVSG